MAYNLTIIPYGLEPYRLVSFLLIAPWVWGGCGCSCSGLRARCFWFRISGKDCARRDQFRLASLVILGLRHLFQTHDPNDPAGEATEKRGGEESLRQLIRAALDEAA